MVVWILGVLSVVFLAWVLYMERREHTHDLTAWAGDRYTMWLLYSDGLLVCGSCTVWQHWPSGGRADRLGARDFHAAWWRITHGQHRGIKTTADKIKAKHAGCDHVEA